MTFILNTKKVAWPWSRKRWHCFRVVTHPASIAFSCFLLLPVASEEKLFVQEFILHLRAAGVLSCYSDLLFLYSIMLCLYDTILQINITVCDNGTCNLLHCWPQRRIFFFFPPSSDLSVTIPHPTHVSLTVITTLLWYCYRHYLTFPGI